MLLFLTGFLNISAYPGPFNTISVLVLQAVVNDPGEPVLDVVALEDNHVVVFVPGTSDNDMFNNPIDTYDCGKHGLEQTVLPNGNVNDDANHVLGMDEAILFQEKTKEDGTVLVGAVVFSETSIFVEDVSRNSKKDINFLIMVSIYICILVFNKGNNLANIYT